MRTVTVTIEDELIEAAEAASISTQIRPSFSL